MRKCHCILRTTNGSNRIGRIKDFIVQYTWARQIVCNKIKFDKCIFTIRKKEHSTQHDVLFRSIRHRQLAYIREHMNVKILSWNMYICMCMTRDGLRWMQTIKLLCELFFSSFHFRKCYLRKQCSLMHSEQWNAHCTPRYSLPSWFRLIFVGATYALAHLGADAAHKTYSSCEN